MHILREMLVDYRGHAGALAIFNDFSVLTTVEYWISENLNVLFVELNLSSGLSFVAHLQVLLVSDTTFCCKRLPMVEK